MIEAANQCLHPQLLLPLPKHLNAARRKFETLPSGHERPGREPFGPRGVDSGRLHAFITEQAQRGASSPWKIVQTLVWAERAFELSLGLESCPGTEIFVEPRRRNPGQEAGEDSVFGDGPPHGGTCCSRRSRTWCGAGQARTAAMAHGCQRWADFQATKNLKLTKDAVFGVSWRMKGKKTHVPWAAPRVGFTWARLGFCLVVGACCCRPPRRGLHPEGTKFVMDIVCESHGQGPQGQCPLDETFPSQAACLSDQGRCTRRKRNASPEHHHLHPERARVRLHHPDLRALRTQRRWKWCPR